MSDLNKSIQLTEDQLAGMPMSEVFNLIVKIQDHCEQATKELKIHSDNMKVIHEFINKHTL